MALRSLPCSPRRGQVTPGRIPSTWCPRWSTAPCTVSWDSLAGAADALGYGWGAHVPPSPPPWPLRVTRYVLETWARLRVVTVWAHRLRPGVVNVMIDAIHGCELQQAYGYGGTVSVNEIAILRCRSVRERFPAYFVMMNGTSRWLARLQGAPKTTILRVAVGTRRNCSGRGE